MDRLKKRGIKMVPLSLTAPFVQRGECDANQKFILNPAVALSA